MNFSKTRSIYLESVKDAKKASFSLNALLKNTAKQAAIDSIPSSFIYSSISEFANWLFCRF